MEPIRLGFVRYLNTVPLVEGLEKLEGVVMVPLVPSRIAGMLLAGDVDIGLVSLIDAARSEGALSLLPAGMIGCDGPTLTVRLFSSVPLAQVRTVHADSDSHTSVVLCQVVLEKLHGVRATVVEFDARERVETGRSAAGSGEWPEALLLIGDKVVTDSPPAVRYPYQLDLGEAWHELTGLPFVYAMWACRTAEVGTRKIASAGVLLERQLRHNLTRLDWIIRTRAPEQRWPADLARRYIGELLRYEVGAREREAVGVFFREAARLGLAPGAGEKAGVRWCELGAGAPGTEAVRTQ
jgi:chorismate dehydratase